jgi:hypothetical protein
MLFHIYANCMYELAICGSLYRYDLNIYAHDIGMQGDTLQRWRTEPFIMITGSGR